MGKGVLKPGGLILTLGDGIRGCLGGAYNWRGKNLLNAKDHTTLDKL